MKINLNVIKEGDIFSEESHYVAQNITPLGVTFKHLESDSKVTLGTNYVTNLLTSADQFDAELKVTREDKKDGTLGIRSIFENINSSKVFTVIFQKQDVPKTNKALNAEIEAKVEEFASAIEKAKTQKKGVSKIAKKAFEDFMSNPITDVIKGKDRVLRGYKVQFSSRDGKYNCIDIDLKMKGEANAIRPVNINTIKELHLDGIKYIVVK